MAGEAKTPVTVIGLGAMGSALARAYLAAGHPTTVWNRSVEKAAPLVARGAARAASVGEAVAASPLVIVCVLDYAAVQRVLADAGDALAGKVLVNLTNGTPEQAREADGWAGRHGAAGYLDGGIMAVPSMIGAPEAFILYSGTPAAFEEHRPTLERLAAGRYLGADPGLAALNDMALLSGMYGMLGGFVHAVALVGTERIPATEFTTSLLVPWLNAMAGALPAMAAQIDAGDYASQEASLEMQTSGEGLVEFSEARGVRSTLVAPVQALMEQRVAQGRGGDDFASIIELIRQRRDDVKAA